MPLLRKTSVAGILAVFDKLIARLAAHAAAERKKAERIALKTEVTRQAFERKLAELDHAEATHGIEALNADAAIVRIKRSIYGEEPSYTTPVVSVITPGEKVEFTGTVQIHPNDLPPDELEKLRRAAANDSGRFVKAAREEAGELEIRDLTPAELEKLKLDMAETALFSSKNVA